MKAGRTDQRDGDVTAEARRAAVYGAAAVDFFQV
jgi:hypothetical protein